MALRRVQADVCVTWKVAWYIARCRWYSNRLLPREDRERDCRKRCVCAVIPTYNNAGRLPMWWSVHWCIVRMSLWWMTVQRTIQPGCWPVLGDRITVCTHQSNRGKGQALLTGFRQAAKAGMTAVVTLDSDGQHDPGDIPLLEARHMESPSAIIVGSRDIQARNMPEKTHLPTGSPISGSVFRRVSPFRIHRQVLGCIH